MKLFKKKQPKPECQAPNCSNLLPEDPYRIVMGELDIEVCNECARFIEVLSQKFEEREYDE